MPAACPTCGSAVEEGQEYCLECGRRIGAPPRPVLHWIWPSLAALVVAAGGAAVAVAAGTDSPTETVVALSPLRVAPGLASPATKGLTTWRRDDGYTIVVASIPAERGAAVARKRAREAVRAGLKDVGVLVSSAYASLHPGYHLVFSGVYDAPEEAEAALPRARSRFRSAHVQRIAR